MTGANHGLRLRGHQLLRDALQVPLSNPTLKIIDGNLSGATACILYNDTDPTLSAFYDPDIDTSYPTGLGRAWLMDEFGQQDSRVLVRHDFSGAPAPLVAGWVYKSRGSRILTVASGLHAGETMVAYLVTWDL